MNGTQCHLPQLALSATLAGDSPFRSFDWPKSLKLPNQHFSFSQSLLWALEPKSVTLNVEATHEKTTILRGVKTQKTIILHFPSRQMGHMSL